MILTLLARSCTKSGLQGGATRLRLQQTPMRGINTTRLPNQFATTARSPGRFAKLSRFLTWAALIAVVTLWALYLFVQRGQPWDECEHTHTAWLMSQGEKPLDDFFEHHQPLLWSLLALYYRAGFSGAGVLIWGRILVVLSALASAAALLVLGNFDARSPRLRALLGCGLFIVLTLTLREVFVIRPETIAAAMFFVALALWTTKCDTAYIAIAGMLAGLAVYASPRAAVLGGFFLLLGTNTLRRWLVFIGGGFLAIAIYTMVSGYPLSRIIFNLQFSSYLQSVGDKAYGLSTALWVGLMLATCVPLALLVYGLAPAHRRRAAGLIAYAVLVFLVCHASAGLFQYQHAYSPFLVAVAIAGAWIGGRLQWLMHANRALAPTVVATMLFPALISIPGLTSLKMMRIPGADFFASVRARDKMAALVPPGGTVLLYPQDNPITVKDASYYGIPLWDAQDRLCRAIRGFASKSSVPLPECDFLKTLRQKKPYLTETWIDRVAPSSREQNVKNILEEDYRVLDLGPHTPPYMRGSILVRNEK